MRCFSDDLFDITFTEKIEESQEWDNFLRSVKQRLPKITRIFVNCYRDGTAGTEIVIHYNNPEEILLLTILSDDLNFSPVSDEDMRVNHKKISLPNAADVLILVTRLARYAGLSPSLSTDADSSSLLEFSS